MTHSCTQAEWRILALLWERGAMTAGQLIEALQAENGWTQHAVCTLLERLEQKGLIGLEENGSLRRYVCKQSRQQVSIARCPLECSLPQRLKNRLPVGGKHQ